MVFGRQLQSLRERAGPSRCCRSPRARIRPWACSTSSGSPRRKLPDLLCTECLTGALYLDKQHEVASYLEALDHICNLAETTDRSVTILTETLKEM